MTDQKWGALAEAVKAQRDSLRLRQKDLAALGGPSYETMRLIETNKLGSDQDRTLQPRTIAGLERALRWKPGTVKAILDGSAGNDPNEWVARPQGGHVQDHAGGDDSVTVGHPGRTADQIQSMLDRHEDAGEALRFYNLVLDRYGSEPESKPVLAAVRDFMTYLHKKQD